MAVLRVFDGTTIHEIPGGGGGGGAGDVTAAANMTDHAIIRGDGGGKGVQDSTATIADNGVVSIPGIGSGAVTAYDLIVGNIANYGMLRLGDFRIGRTSFDAGNINLNGAVLLSNLGGPVDGKIEFIFTESTGGTCRFALPKSGVGYATYNPRSMLIIGPAPANTDFVDVTYWQALGWFHNLLCDTSGSGADLGVQNDLEVEGNIYADDIVESTTDAGVTVEGVELKDGLVDGVDVSTLATKSFAIAMAVAL